MPTHRKQVDMPLIALNSYCKNSSEYILATIQARRNAIRIGKYYGNRQSTTHIQFHETSIKPLKWIKGTMNFFRKHPVK